MEELIEHVWRKNYTLSLLDIQQLSKESGINKEDLLIFEGPFDLLLSLIDNKKLDILTIKISDIIEQYIAYIKLLSVYDMDISSDFIEMAALLMYLKSKEIVPTLDQVNSYDPYDSDFYMDPDDDGSFSDIHDLETLRKRLIRYKAILVAREYLGKIQCNNRFYRDPEYTEKDIKLSFKNFSLPKMMDTYISMLGTVVPKTRENEEKIIKEYKFTIKEKILLLIDNLAKYNEFDYFSLIDNKNIDKQEILTTFLAVLELAKEQALTFRQDENERIIVRLKENVDLDKIKNIDFEKDYEQTNEEEKVNE